MTGTRSSNWRRCLGLLLAGNLPGILLADDLTLTGDARLTGTVRSINDAGVVELASPLSPEPVLLKPGAVAKVEFTAPEIEPTPPGTLVELINGDVLPATIESLDEKQLAIVTADAGRLTIPRPALKSLQLGVRKRRVIYSGPRSLDEWTRDGDGLRGWTFASKALAADGPAYASKNFNTPERFVFKFTLQWESSPSFQVYFADPLTPKISAVDRYYLQFNGAGLEIKRECSEGQHFRTVISLPGRTPDLYPNNQLAVEIRVDRKTSRIHLFLNGEPETPVVDLVPTAPKGNGVSLVSSAPPGATQSIRDIEIAEFDNARARHKSEKRGDAKSDSLITRDEERLSGSVIGIHKGDDGMIFTLKNIFQETPLELIEDDVSTVFFTTPEPQPGPEQIHPFSLRLRGEGFLRVSSCSFTEAGVTATHPLLGVLQLSRAGIAALERRDEKPDAEPEEEAESEE
jgi:hypothetical protein